MTASGSPGTPAGMPRHPFGGRGPHLTRPQRCVRAVPSLAPSEQRAKTIPPSTPGPTEVSLSAPRSVQGGKDAEKRRADLDYPCRKPAAAARSPRNDQREGGRPAFRPFALSRTGQERCPGSRRETSCGWDRNGGSVPFAALAAREGVSSSYFTRLVRLSYLAPDITQAILDGRQPRDLTAEQL